MSALVLAGTCALGGILIGVGVLLTIEGLARAQETADEAWRKGLAERWASPKEEER